MKHFLILSQVVGFVVIVNVASLQQISRQRRRSLPRGSTRSLDDSEEDSSTKRGNSEPVNVKGDNFDRRRRILAKAGQLKCKDQNEASSQGVDYQYVNCVPTDSQNFDTEFPTRSPTISPVPTITAFPSSPTQNKGSPISTQAPKSSNGAPAAPPVAPSLSLPTLYPSTTPFEWFAPISPDPEFAPACDAAHNGIVFKTNHTLQVSFVYELATNSSFPVENVVDTLEQRVGAYLAKELVPCSEDDIRRHRERLLLSSSSRSLDAPQNQLNRHLLLRGIGPGDRDVPIGDRSCEVLVNSTTVAYDCYVMQGSIDLYVSETDGMTENQASTLIFNLLRNEFNGNATDDSNGRARLLQLQDTFLNESEGILGLFFRGSTLQSDADVTSSGDVPSYPEKEFTSSAESSVNTVSGIGITFVVMACIGAVLVALIVARKRSIQFKRNRGVELGDTDTLASSPRKRGKKSWDDNDDDNSLPGDIVAYDSSSILHDLDADTHVDFQEQYVNGTGEIDEGLEVMATVAKANPDSYQTPSAYGKRDKYQSRDTVDL